MKNSYNLGFADEEYSNTIGFVEDDDNSNFDDDNFNAVGISTTRKLNAPRVKRRSFLKRSPARKLKIAENRQARVLRGKKKAMAKAPQVKSMSTRQAESVKSEAPIVPKIGMRSTSTKSGSTSGASKGSSTTKKGEVKSGETMPETTENKKFMGIMPVKTAKIVGFSLVGLGVVGILFKVFKK